jgi:phi13 family phage major tail protein
MSKGTAVEYRGVDNLVFAPVLVDNNDSGTSGGYKTGSVKVLAPVAEISKSVEQSSATKYYDNLPAIVINSKGSDTISITIPVLDLETLAEITNQFVDPDTGALSEGSSTEPKYYALGYRFKLTDGSYRLVWRYKGQFGLPEDNSKTEDDSTDSANQSLEFTGISTMHRFAKGGAAKALVVDERDGLADIDSFFDVVTTIDLLQEVS